MEAKSLEMVFSKALIALKIPTNAVIPIVMMMTVKIVLSS